METIKSELEEILSLSNSVSIENQELSKEITSLLNSSDLIMVLVYSRRCLEVMVADICESMLGRERGTEPMKGIIDKISKEKLVPEFITTAMYNVNNNSTYGAHPKDFDKRQVRSTLIDLTTVFDWYFFDLKKLEKRVSTTSTIQTPKEKPVKQAATNPIPTQQNKETATSPKKSSFKTYSILGAVVIIMAVVVYLVFVQKKTNFTENTDQKKPVINDSTPIKKNDSSTVSIKSPAENAKTAETTKPETDKPIIKANNAVKLLELPENIEEAIKMLGNPQILTEVKKATFPKFKERFTANARIDIVKNGFSMEPKTVDDFLSWNIISGKLFDIKVLSSEKTGNKIKILKIDVTDK